MQPRKSLVYVEIGDKARWLVISFGTDSLVTWKMYWWTDKATRPLYLFINPSNDLVSNLHIFMLNHLFIELSL